MIVACRSCSRRYRDLQQGFRCICGADVPVQQIQPFFPEIIRCSSCGGSIDRDTLQCVYCSNVVHEFDESRYCVACFAFLERAGKFCSACGARAVDIERVPLPKALVCPRDGRPLQGLFLKSYPLAECPSCFGIWMEVEQFEQFVEAGGLAANDSAKPEAGKAAFDPKVAYIGCPECGEQMARKNFEKISGIILDSCPKHGVWLDRHELEDISRFLLRGGLNRSKKAKEKEQQRLKEEWKKLGIRTPDFDNDV